jgi:hypothetical protein
MKRWVLLGIQDHEVDVLTRLTRSATDSEVVVYHPNPGALVLQLADLAELRALDRLPEPRPDDVLVISSRPGTERWEEAWRRVGARVLTSQAVGANGEERDADATSVSPANGDEGNAEPVSLAPANGDERDTASVPVAQTGAGADEPVPQSQALDISSMREGETMDEERAPQHEGHEVAMMDAVPRPGQDPASGPMPGGMNPEVWSSPEATLRYLMGEAGADRFTLWWDGETDTWVPLAWRGPDPGSVAAGSRPEGTEISHRWGRFLVSGADEHRLYRPGLARVAEDMALRDLEDWRRSRDRLRGHIPTEHLADLPAWARWLDEALPVLGAEAVLLWLRQDGAWRLARAWGEGVGLAGELRLPEALFTATFGPASAWRSWQPWSGYRVLFTPRPGDHTWPLRQARLDQLLSEVKAH